VLEALRSGREIDRILMAEGIEFGPQLQDIVVLADQAGIPVEALDRDEIEARSATKKAQGVIAEVPDHRYSSVEDMVMAADAAGQAPLICVLDGIQDPHNLGAIARTLDAAGGHGLVIPERRAVGVTPGAVRASAGALEHVAVCRAKNLGRAVESLKVMKLKVIGLDAEGETDYTEPDYTEPVAIVVGSEGEGMSQRVRTVCDALVSIPMLGKLASLNASVSTGIVLFEAVRQRRQSSP
jgi:23S rRNA (guanosine2251-2'-O)-methyltransferase